MELTAVQKQFQTRCLVTAAALPKAPQGDAPWAAPLSSLRRQIPEAGSLGSQQVSVLLTQGESKSSCAPCSHQTNGLYVFRASISSDSILEPALALMLSPTSPQSFCCNSRKARRWERIISEIR